MMSCWWTCAFGCVVGLATWLVGSEASAQEVASEPDALGPRGGDARGRHEDGDGARRPEHVRVDLGIGFLGGLGSAVPVATAALEAHLGGPAWLVVGGSAGWSQWEDAGSSSTSTSGGARVGPRFEWHVVERFAAGFHGFASASFAHAEATSTSDGLGGSPAVDVVDVGGVAGASIHFRASRVFGVRVVLDLARGGYVTANHADRESSSGYAQIAPSPSAELTFTF